MATGDAGDAPRAAVSAHGDLEVQVAAGLPDRQELVEVVLPAGSTVIDAVRVSGILERFPEFRDLELDYAIHGVRTSARQPLATGDRVELLRPLQVDPRESRRRRARLRG